jgi:murein DD-endopeptidase MepM/ murein hydrolase activator NlpD
VTSDRTPAAGLIGPAPHPPLRRRVNRARVRALGAFVIGVPLLFSAIAGVPVTSADDYRDEIKEALERQKQLQQQIKNQKQTIGELRSAEAQLQSALNETSAQLDDINADQTVVRKQIAAAEAALRVVEARYAKLVAELAHLDWTLNVLSAQLTQAEQDLDQRRRLLAQRLADAYRIQQTSMLEQVIASDSFSEVLASVGSHLRFGDQDAQLAKQIGRDEQSLDALRRTTAATRYRTDQVRLEVREQQIKIEAQRAKLLAAKKRLEALEAATKRLQAQQLATYRNVIRNKAAAERILRSQGAAQVRLKGEIAALVAKQRSYGNIPSRYNGTFAWPMKGQISQEFGCTGFPWEPPLGSCAHFHRGIDMVAVNGAPITSAADGVIVFVGYNPYDSPSDPAWIVLVAHSENLISWYGHLQPIVPKGIYEGAKVRKGALIGYEGNTGRSTGPHLHWAVQLDNQFVNPRLFV